MNRSRRGHRGFSLLEVVIVVAIIAILAAIGIPRMSRGSKGANDSALSGDLAVLRNAIDLYAAEHGGAFPTVANIKEQLMTYTNASGVTNPTKTTAYIYGPYLRGVPPLPVGPYKTKTAITAAADPNSGWIYTESTGAIQANVPGGLLDEAGKAYAEY